MPKQVEKNVCTDIPRQVRHSSVERRTVQFPDNSDLSDLNSFKTLMDLVLVLPHFNLDTEVKRIISNSLAGGGPGA